MNYIFYAAKTVKLKACVTKFLRHICCCLHCHCQPEKSLNPTHETQWVLGVLSRVLRMSLSRCQMGFTSLKHSPRCYMFRVLSVPVGFRLYPVCLHFWDADFLWQVQPCPCISDPGSPNSWMEHTCYFLLCKPPPPPCLFMLSIPISDILPLVPSKIFHTSRYFHGNQSRGDKKAAC